MVHGYGQTGLNFQGVARTNNNIILASQPISLRLSILQGSASGIAEYVETRRVTTNAQGLFTAVIGDTGAISTLGNFTTINWRNTPKFLKIEMDVAAGTNFITMGTTQFQYVAYAQFANSVDAENITGVVPVARGGTGANSLSSFKSTLALDKVNNTSDLSKPISTATQTALDLKLNASDTVKYTKQSWADSALLTKLNLKDTVKFIKQIYADSALLTKLKLSDTASMLSNRIGRDTLNLSARINLKANSSDLTTGLALKLNAIDTSKYTKQNYSDSALLTKLSITGNAATATSASTATKLSTARTINGVAFDGSADINITSTADAGTLTGTTLKSTVTGSSLTSVGTLANLTVTNPIVGSITGNAATATLATNAINAGNITATSNSTLTSLPNLTTVGTITNGTWSGTTIAVASGGTGTGTTTANSVFAGPNGSSGAPSFRGLNITDIPDLSSRYISNNGTADFSNSITVSGQKIGIGDWRTEGRLNLLFGKEALFSASSSEWGTMNTAIGPYSQFSNEGNKNTSLGTFSLSSPGEGNNNTAIGAYSNSRNNSNENNIYATDVYGGGNNNTSIGAYALSYTDVFQSRKYNSFNKNTVIGVYSLSGLSADFPNGISVESNGNTAIGYKAGSTLEIGSNNIIIGDSAQTTSTTVSNQIVIGNASNTSSFIYGALSTVGRISKFVTVTSNYTILSSDEIITANSTSPINIYLPTAVGIAGRTYTIKNINTGSVTLRPSFLQNIDGSNTYELTNRYSFVKVVSNGSIWLVAGLDNVSYSVSGGLTLTDLISSNVKAKTFELTQPSSINSTSTTTLDLSTGNVLQVVLTGSTTLAFTNPKIGTYIIKIKQDATGNWALNFPTIKWSDAAVPTITTTPNAVDLITIIYDGTDYYGSCLQNF
jgi:hypothetical protein